VVQQFERQQRAGDGGVGELAVPVAMTVKEYQASLT